MIYKNEMAWEFNYMYGKTWTMNVFKTNVKKTFEILCSEITLLKDL